MHHRNTRTALLLAFAITLSGCQNTAQTPDSASARNFATQSLDTQAMYGEYRLELQPGGKVGITRHPLDITRFGHTTQTEQKTAVQNVPGQAAQPDEKIQAHLKRKLATTPTDTVRVVINYRDDVTLPVFPVLDRDTDLNGPGADAFKARKDALIGSVMATRASKYKRLSDDLAARHHGKVVDTYWLINAITADVPVSEITSLAAESEVLNITEADLTAPLPLTVGDVRRDMNTDVLQSWMNNGYYTPIGLLDSGVMGPTPHVLLNTYLPQKDCVNNPACTGSSPYDVPMCNHGTASAGLLIGNSNLGDETRGVYNRTVFSYNIHVLYQESGVTKCGTQYQATISAVQQAVANGVGVLDIETQFLGSPTDSLSGAVNAAFDAGRAVIAADGNMNLNGSPGTANYPGGAHKALSIGAANYNDSGKAWYYQSLGPTSDNRTKPDVQAYTCAVTASMVDAGGTPSTSATKSFCGTSGSTPIAAGAAAILYDYMHAVFPQVNPALPATVYVYMIASGSNPAGATDNTNGAGLIRFPGLSNTLGGIATFNLISTGDYYDCNINVNTTDPTRPIRTIKAAAWWAESPSMPHSDIDIRLLSPSGTLLASSLSTASVFEKVQYSPGYQIPDGNYVLRVSAYSANARPLIACAGMTDN